jgi:beta-lactamase class C
MPLDLSSEQVAYAQGLNWAQLAQACLETFPGHAPGEQVQYSNVGYGLLALVVEHTTRMPFPQALEHFVLKPLGIVGTLGGQLAALPVQLADVRGTHAGGPIEPFNSGFWRGLGLPWAGLITDAAGALALVCAFAGTPSGFLRETTRIAATTNQTGGLAGGFAAPMLWPDCPWGLGPELRGQKQPHWAPAGMTESFGHSGASGCLAWADPITDTAWVILGTRTAESGWLLRRGAALSQAILAAL